MQLKKIPLRIRGGYQSTGCNPNSVKNDSHHKKLIVVAGKAGETGPGQTKPRLGTTGKPAKPKQFSVSSQQIYSLYTANIQVSECQISDKMMEIGPNQVYNMAPFGLILS